MTSRQRVLAALNHEDPDRVPIDFGGTFTTGINIGAYEKLKQYLGINTPTRIASQRSQIAVIDETILDRFGIDTRGVSCGVPDNSSYMEYPDGSYRDEWGVLRRRPEGMGHFMDCENPFAGEPSLEDIERHPWFVPDDPGFTRGVGERLKQLHEETDCAVILSLPVGVVHQTQFLRGYEAWMMDTIDNTTFFDGLMDRVTDLVVGVTRNLLRVAGNNVDIVFYGDDIATQSCTVLSREQYLKRIKPWHRRIFDSIRSHASAKILYHSCGSVYPLLPDLIDLGIDAINPVQVAAKDMGDTARLKRDFGRDLSFWGAVDTQHILPHGTPDDVRAEVARRVSDLATGGGYVLNSVHNIQSEVPPENVVAMFDAAIEVG